MGTKKTEEKQVKIVILHRGWVIVGHVTETGGKTIIEGGAVIRRWGTTKGLGEIAEGGPTRSTVLDPCPPVSTLTEAVIATMDCVAEKWAGHLREGSK